MHGFSLSKDPSAAHRLRHRKPVVEVLEDRTLLTHYSVIDVPDTFAMQQATAEVTSTPGEQPEADMTATAQAHPVGMGDQPGYFQIGSERTAFVIQTTPEPGQEIGDPISVSFSFNYLARLRFVMDTGIVPPPSYINYFCRLEAGDDSQDLMEGFFTTDMGIGAEAQDNQVVTLPNQKVGDPMMITLTLQGEAHSAEPHYQDWVDFTGRFSFRDDTSNAAPGRRQERAAMLDVLGGVRPIQPHQDAGTVVTLRTTQATIAADRLGFQDSPAIPMRGQAANIHHWVNPATTASTTDEPAGGDVMLPDRAE
jgi:hypothetical protein